MHFLDLSSDIFHCIVDQIDPSTFFSSMTALGATCRALHDLCNGIAFDRLSEDEGFITRCWAAGFGRLSLVKELFKRGIRPDFKYMVAYGSDGLKSFDTRFEKEHPGDATWVLRRYRRAVNNNGPEEPMSLASHLRNDHWDMPYCYRPSWTTPTFHFSDPEEGTPDDDGYCT
jgi:hypothetical protein